MKLKGASCAEDCSFPTLNQLETIIGHTFSIQVSPKYRQPI